MNLGPTKGLMSVYDTIIDILETSGAQYERITHEAVTHCEDSLAHRTAAGWSGASSKCILFHAKGVFHLVVTTAGEKINGRKFKRQFGTKNIRFASPEEVSGHTGCAIGSMPPLGITSPEVPIYVDARILDAEHFMFNPAVPTKSLRIQTADMPKLYAAVPNPVKWFRPGEDGRFEFAATPVFEDVEP
jgi:prolyl-tRNA editing enzyme YbaK/EbsC (Cys-tRNA(Pro) deacylase)